MRRLWIAGLCVSLVLHGCALMTRESSPAGLVVDDGERVKQMFAGLDDQEAPAEGR